jgi:hypothetical protein
MAIVISVVLKKSKMVLVERWQQEITDQGFDMQLSTGIHVINHTGFWPCIYKAENSGFGYSFSTVKPKSFTAKERKLIGDRDSIADFTLGDGLPTPAIALGVLCHLTDGLIYGETDDPSFIAGDGAIAYAKQTEIDLLEIRAEPVTPMFARTYSPELIAGLQNVKMQISGRGGKKSKKIDLSYLANPRYAELRAKQLAILQAVDGLEDAQCAAQLAELDAINAELDNIRG